MPGILDGWFSLDNDTNTVKGQEPTEAKEGVAGPRQSYLSLETDDEDLLKLKNDWEKNWEKYSEELRKRQERVEGYWKGRRVRGQEAENTFLDANDKTPIPDNLLFEAMETFLPIVTRQNPEPVVFSNETMNGEKMASDLRKTLISLSDALQFKLRVQEMVRHWGLYFLGCMKLGYSEAEGEIDMYAVRPQRLILDKDATVDVSGKYLGKFIGEVCEESAEDLALRFPDHEDYIRSKADGKMGTRMRYTQWWTDEMFFVTLDKKVLHKSRNPHFNYPEEQLQMDEFGQEQMVQTQRWNHFSRPLKPYVFLSVFNLGLHPFDDVSIMEQNIRLQDMVTKRLAQVDRNADNANGGIVVSGSDTGLSAEQAAQAAEAFANGGAIFIPNGSASGGVVRMAGPPLPSYVMDSLMDYRNELRSVFGVRASTAEGVVSTDTVRGKILAKSQDESRMALIASRIEQVSDQIFNWMVQLISVYYDEPHVASYIGDDKAHEFISLSSDDLSGKIIVSVKEGSMIPKDPLTRRNEAIDLWSASALDPITLFERLDFPNPQEAARKLVMWQTNPGGLVGMPPPAPMVPGAPGTPGAAPENGLPAPLPAGPQGQDALPAPSTKAAVEVPLAQADLRNVPIE